MPIHIERWGAADGPTVVLLHGIPTAADVLEPIVRPLEATHRLLTVHSPGYGKSASEPARDWTRTLDGIERALSALGVTDAALVGLSGGALRALHLASRGAVRATGIVALAGLARVSDEARAQYRALAPALRGGTTFQSFAGPALLSPRWLATREGLALVNAWGTAISPSALADELESVADAPDVLDALSRLTCPVLARTGADDVSCPVPCARELADACRGELQLVDRVAHALTLEDLEATRAVVCDFVKALAAR